jgi:monoamine oxidase
MKRRTFLTAVGGLSFCNGSLLAAPRIRRDETIVAIGAGMAGLAAAANLKKQGSKVVVLESRGRIGGRMKTDRSLGCAVDLGASWVHGIDGNPLVELARASGAQLARTQFDDMLPFDEMGAKFDRSTVLKTYLRLESFLASAPKDIRTTRSDESLQTILEPHVASMKWTAPEKRAFDFVSALTEISDGAKFEELSARDSSEYKENSGGDQLVVSGYDTIARHLASGLEIKTNVSVQTVDYREREIKLVTSGGTLQADRVVITVPLGVLQRGKIRFVPALPKDKQTAINRMGMGVINKIALSFQQPFWPRHSQVIGYLGAVRGTYPLFVNLLHYTGQPVLVCLVPPSFENALENLTEADAKAGVLDVLRKIFGSHVPEPVSVLQTRWKSDPWSLGAYSFDKLGATGTDRDQLAAPIDCRLFFAGEATHRTMYSTVHGAYLSGCRAAREINENVCARL